MAMVASREPRANVVDFMMFVNAFRGRWYLSSKLQDASVFFLGDIVCSCRDRLW